MMKLKSITKEPQKYDEDTKKAKVTSGGLDAAEYEKDRAEKGISSKRASGGSEENLRQVAAAKALEAKTLKENEAQKKSRIFTNTQVKKDTGVGGVQESLKNEEKSKPITNTGLEDYQKKHKQDKPKADEAAIGSYKAKGAKKMKLMKKGSKSC